jgi:hypothetical protein
MKHLAILAAYLTLLGSPLSAQMVPSPVLPLVSPRAPYVAFDLLAKLDGLTFCVDGKVTYWIDGMIDSTEEKATRVHELKHVEQYHRYPSCAAFELYYRTPQGRMDSEMEAYVAGWCSVYSEMDDPTQIKRNSLRIFAEMGYDIFYALQQWKKYEALECPGHPEDTNIAP